MITISTSIAAKPRNMVITAKQKKISIDSRDEEATTDNERVGGG